MPGLKSSRYDRGNGYFELEGERSFCELNGRLYAEATGNTKYLKDSEYIRRGSLAPFFEDGRATCSQIFVGR